MAPCLINAGIDQQKNKKSMSIYNKDNSIVKRAGVFKRLGVFIFAGLVVALMSVGGYFYAVEKTTDYLVNNLVIASTPYLK